MCDVARREDTLASWSQQPLAQTAANDPLTFVAGPVPMETAALNEKFPLIEFTVDSVIVSVPLVLV